MYNFYCKTCGYGVSGNKEEARTARLNHKIRINDELDIRTCPLIKLPNGLFTRPDLKESAYARYIFKAKHQRV